MYYLVNPVLNKRANIDSLREKSLIIYNQIVFLEELDASRLNSLFL